MGILCHLLLRIIPMGFWWCCLIFCLFPFIDQNEEIQKLCCFCCHFPRIHLNLTLDPNCHFFCTKHVPPSRPPHLGNRSTTLCKPEIWESLVIPLSLSDLQHLIYQEVSTFCLLHLNILSMENICCALGLPSHTILVFGEYPTLWIYFPH